MMQMIKNLIVFLLYFIYSQVIIALLAYFGFDYLGLSNDNKILFFFIIDVLFIISLIFLYFKEIKTDFKDYKKNYKKYFGYLKVYMIGVILMGLSNIVLQMILNTGVSENEQSIRDLIPRFPLYISFSAILYAPFVEELIFRKVIKNIVSNKYAFYFIKMFKKDTKKLETYAFIILSGLIFGLIHVTNDTDITQLLLGIPYVIMGIDFAYIYHKTNNIFTTMVFHSLHNTILLLIQFIFY